MVTYKCDRLRAICRDADGWESSDLPFQNNQQWWVACADELLAGGRGDLSQLNWLHLPVHSLRGAGHGHAVEWSFADGADGWATVSRLRLQLVQATQGQQKMLIQQPRCQCAQKCLANPPSKSFRHNLVLLCFFFAPHCVAHSVSHHFVWRACIVRSAPCTQSEDNLQGTCIKATIQHCYCHRQLLLLL